MLCPFCHTDNPESAVLCRACGVALDKQHDFAEEVLPIGAVLQQGAYVINRVLGQGGFGITYLGSDTHLGRAVAIKEFFPTGCYRKDAGIQPSGPLARAEFQDAKQRFLEEARTLARFRHPGIVDVFAAFEENNTAYMVMEYLLGKTLGTIVREQGRLKQSQAIGFIREAGEALEVVHSAGLLHRDIKPENLMLCHDGRIVLIDFGTARDFSVGRTQGHTVVVTPGYAPLEQYAQRAQHGVFSDVYGLAATLFFVLTGEAPPPATDRAAGVEFVPPHQLEPEVSAHVGQAVQWAMELKIDERPQSVREFLDALDSQAPLSTPSRSLSPVRARESKIIVRSSGRQYVYVQTDRTTKGPTELQWPDKCACCGAAPAVLDPLFSLTAGDLAPAAQVWHVPYCSWCIKHAENGKVKQFPIPGGVLALFLLCMGILALVWSAMAESSVPMVLWFLGSVIAGSMYAVNPYRSSGVIKPTCWTLGAAVTCTNIWHDDKDQIVYTLEFKSPIYREAFEKLNNAYKPLT